MTRKSTAETGAWDTRRPVMRRPPDLPSRTSSSRTSSSRTPSSRNSKPANSAHRTSAPKRGGRGSTRGGSTRGGSTGGRIGLWAALAGITGVGVAIALRRSRAKADARATAADRGEAVPDASRAEAVYRARETALAEITSPAHVAMTDDEFEYDRHGATVLGSAHPAPGAGRPRTVHGRSYGERPADEEPGRAGMA